MHGGHNGSGEIDRERSARYASKHCLTTYSNVGRVAYWLAIDVFATGYGEGLRGCLGDVL